jgi:hypothetical protein
LTAAATLSIPSGLVFAGDPVLIVGSGTTSSNILNAQSSLSINQVQFFNLASVLTRTLSDFDGLVQRVAGNLPVASPQPTNWTALYVDYLAAYGLGGTLTWNVEVIGAVTISGVFIAALADVVGSDSTRRVTDLSGLNPGETSTTLTISTPPTTVQANIGWASGDVASLITFVPGSPPVTTDVATVTDHSMALTICSLAPVDNSNVMTISNISSFLSGGMKIWLSFRPPLVTAAHKSFAALIGD